MITLEEYRDVKSAMNESLEKDTVNLVIQDDEMHVVGDPNKTKVKKHDYKVRFAFPNTEKYKKMLKNEQILKETANYLVMEQEFKDVFVSPRLHSSVLSSFSEVYAMFVYITDDGELRDLTPEEELNVLKMMGEDVTNRMYHAVATVLEIESDYEDFMLIGDVVKVMVQLIVDFPEIINDTDLFFA